MPPAHKGLRAPLAILVCVVEWAVLLFPFTVPRRARRQGLRVPWALAAVAVCDPVTACAAPC